MAADGNEFFYINPDKKLVAVDIKRGEGSQVGAPKELFETHLVTLGEGFPDIEYVVAENGQPFLLNSVPASATDPISIVMNWKTLLQK
jgi:hypothetical protein